MSVIAFSRALLRGVAVLVAAVVAAATLTACGGAGPESSADDTGRRAVTAEEAERLAVMRYRNFSRGIVPVRIALRANGQDVAISGAVDMRRGRGYATFLASGSTSSGGLIQWTLHKVALLPNGAAEAVRPPPSSGWQVRPTAPESSTLDTALATVLALASDRPENPLLLQQNGAAHLARQELRGREVDAFRGPDVSDEAGATRGSRLTYLIDDAGTLQRVVVDLPSGDGPVTIDLLAGAESEIPLITALR